MDISKEELLQSVRDVVKEIVVDVPLKKDLVAEEKAEEKKLNEKFKTFGEFLTSIYQIRQFGTPDNRLVFKDSLEKTYVPAPNVHGKATLVEGTDSTGGYVTA